MKTFFCLITIVFFSGCGIAYRAQANQSFFDEAVGQCSPNGLTGPFIDHNGDGLVDCELFVGGMPVFFTNSLEEALNKRRAYLHYLIHSEYIRWQEKTPEQLQNLIQNCKGELYVAPKGCTGEELLPYPGGFAIWVTRDSDTGKHSQAEYERRYKPQAPRRPEEARRLQKRAVKTVAVAESIALPHLCPKPTISEYFDMLLILYYSCGKDGQLDEYYSYLAPRGGEKQSGATVWYNFTENCPIHVDQKCLSRDSEKGKALQLSFEEKLKKRRE